MASLRDIFNNRIKKPISSILANSAKGYGILGNKLNTIINPPQVQARRQSFIQPITQGVGSFARGIVQAPRDVGTGAFQFFKSVPQTLAGDIGAVRGIPRTAAQIQAQQQFRQAGNKTVAGAVRTALTFGAPLAGKAAVFGSTLLGGGMGGLQAGFSKQNISEGIGKGAAEGVQYAGLNKLTTPLINPLAKTIGGTTGKLATILRNGRKVKVKDLAIAEKIGRFLGVSVGQGLGNVAENEAYERLAKNRVPSGSERVGSFALGALFTGLTNGNILFEKGVFRNKAGQLFDPISGRWVKASLKVKQLQNQMFESVTGESINTNTTLKEIVPNENNVLGGMRLEPKGRSRLATDPRGGFIDPGGFTANKDPLIQEAREMKSAGKTLNDFISSVRSGSATQYGKYFPNARLAGLDGYENITKLGIDPNETVTIYRGIDDLTGKIPVKINDGDFVTTDFDSALSYTGSPDKVAQMEVKAKDLFVSEPRDFKDKPFYIGSEYIYTSKSGKNKLPSEEELTKLWNKANTFGKSISANPQAGFINFFKGKPNLETPPSKAATIQPLLAQQDILSVPRTVDTTSVLPSTQNTLQKNIPVDTRTNIPSSLLNGTPLGKVLTNTSQGGMALDPNLRVDQIIASTVESPRLQSKGLFPQQQAKSPSIFPKVDQKLSENRVGQKPLETKLPTLEGSTSKNIVPRRTTMASDLNTKRLDLSPEQQQRVLDSQIKEVREVLSDKEITKIAQSAGIDTKTNSIDQTAKKIAEQLNVRRQVVELENQRTKLLDEGASTEELEKVTRQIAETSRISREQGTDVARQLSARRIIANEINTPMQRIFQLLDHHGVNSDVYAKDAAKLDFNNGEAVVDFYRKYVPATKGEKLDLLRYNSMLSSPNTAINNIFSNLQGTSLIAPVEKTITGGLDALKSALTGKPRSYYAGEGGAYAKGYLKSVGEAMRNFSKVMKGENLSANPDYKYIPLTQSGTPGRRLEGLLSRPMRFLEATDQFFTALTRGGETASLNYRVGKGGTVRNLDLQADAAAAKRLFRSDLGDNSGSHALNAIDYLANQIQKAKGNKNPVVSTIAKYSLPFVRTPTNILKQGVEYSPAGFGTLWGSSTKTEQLSKAMLGTSIAVGAATLLGTDRLSFAEPTGEKQKQAFKAAGMQAYSVKIGDKWISYSRLHPAVAFNLALLAAVKNGEDNKELDENQAQTALKIGAKWMNFFADQSYVKSIGDLVGTTKGDIEAPTRLIGNYVQQTIPFRALMGWVARLVDPYQRQVDPDGGLMEKQLQQLATQIPFLSMSVPARKDQFGNPIESQNRVLNAFSPNRVTTENSEAKKDFEFLQEKSRFEKQKKQLKEIFEREAKSASPTVGQVSASDEFIEGKGVPETGERGGLLGIFDKLTGKNKPAPVVSESEPGTIRSLSKLEKDKLKTYIEFGKSVPADDLANYYLGDIPSSKSKSAYDTTVRQKALFKALERIEDDEMLSEEQRQVLRDRIATETGLEQKDLDYYQVAQQDSELKYQKVLDDAASLESRDELYKYLSENRKVINGKLVASDEVIDQLYEDGYLEDPERDYLKALRWDQKKKKAYLDRDFKAKGSGTGKKKLAAYFNALEGVQKAQGQLQTASRIQPMSLGKSNLETVLSQSRAGISNKSRTLESIFSQLEASKKKLRNLRMT